MGGWGKREPVNQGKWKIGSYKFRNYFGLSFLLWKLLKLKFIKFGSSSSSSNSSLDSGSYLFEIYDLD
jgi:hypothetical protein